MKKIRLDTAGGSLEVILLAQHKEPAEQEKVDRQNLITHFETFRAYRLVNIDQFTSIKQIEYMTFELAQQLSRIWLGNPGETVRTRWKEEWFKEGMATYLAYYFLTQVFE